MNNSLELEVDWDTLDDDDPLEDEELDCDTLE